MKALLPQPQDEPRPVEMVVAVDSIETVEYTLVSLDAESGYPKGKRLAVFGCNVKAGTLYVHGDISKHLRIAAEREEYEHEILLRPLPNYMAEINPKDYPGCFMLVISNGELVEMPEPENEAAPQCRVIQHPAAYEALEAQRMYDLARSIKKYKKRASKAERKAKQKPKDPKQIFLTFEPEFNLTEKSA